MNTTDELATFYRLLDFLPVAIAVDEVIGAGEDGFTQARTKFHNRTFLQVIGYTVDEVAHTQAWLHAAYPDPQYRQQVLSQVVTSQHVSRSQGTTLTANTVCIRCKDGQDRWFTIHQDAESPIYQNYKVFVFLDVTVLKTHLAEVDRLARTDMLTGLLNRRALYEQLEHERAQVRISRKPWACVLGDIDHFKHLNDTYGHECGDYVLRMVAHLCQQTLRASDYVARWGGEEFCFVLPETSVDETQMVIERLCTNLAATTFVWNAMPLSVTMTFGVASHDGTCTVAETLRHADAALYQGKAQGRNRVVVWTGAPIT